MKRISFLLLLLLSGFSALALEAEKPKPDPILGTWRGYLTNDHQGYQVSIDVSKNGNAYIGKGLIWSGLGEEQARGTVKGVRPAAAAQSTITCCYQENFAISVVGETISFKGANVQFAISSVVSPKTGVDTFTGKLNPAGVVIGELTDGNKKLGIFELAKEDVLKTPLPLEIEKGKTVQLGCVDGGEYHYSVYLPQNYDPSRAWPVMIRFSPGGGGVPFSCKMADELGWIMVGLTESHNGDWKPIVQNRDSVMFDLRRRFNIDWKHVVFGGFSGGARHSSRAALTYPDLCVGLVLVGAAYDGKFNTNTYTNLPIYFITGETDMNRKEVEREYELAKKVGRKTEKALHPGGHEDAPEEFKEAALKWLVQAIAPPAPVAKVPALKK
jgi:predicted esterase